MGGWIKYFADGQKCVGLDRDVDQGRASWSKSRCHSVVGVDLNHGSVALSIVGPGEYWQSDGYEGLMGESKCQMVARRISRLVEPGDRLVFKQEVQQPASSKPSTCKATFSKVDGFPLDDYVGQWCVLEVSLREVPWKAHMYFATKRI